MQVNLIADAERRSGSQVRWSFILTIAGFSLLGVMLFLLGSLVFGAHKSGRTLAALKQQFEQVDQAHSKVKAMQQELQQYQGVADGPDAWVASGLSVPKVLKGAVVCVPTNMQFTFFNLSETMSTISNTVTRSRILSIRGKVHGDLEGEQVLRFEADLTNQPVFTGMVQEVTVRKFVASEDTNEPEVRLFDIECKLVDQAVMKAQAAKKVLIPGDGCTEF